MKKTIIILIFFIPILTFSQSNKSLQTQNDEYCTFIKPSIFNVVKLLFMSNSAFINTMSQYNYHETASGIGYMVKTTTRSHFRIIKKDSRSVIMNFAPNNIDLISNFRKEIKSVLNNPTVEYEDGYETYRLLIPHDGMKYKVTFRLKEDESSDYINGKYIPFSNGSLIVIID